MKKRGILNCHWNKKADDILISTVIFVVIVGIFFSMLLLFVNRAGTSAGIYEQIYSKKIALIIDKAKSGTDIKMDISEIYNVAEKNKFKGEIINIGNKDKKVIVRLTSGKGYGYKFFNGADIAWNLDENKKLIISVK